MRKASCTSSKINLRPRNDRIGVRFRESAPKWTVDRKPGLKTFQWMAFSFQGLSFWDKPIHFPWGKAPSLCFSPRWSIIQAPGLWPKAIEKCSSTHWIVGMKVPTKRLLVESKPKESPPTAEKDRLGSSLGMATRYIQLSPTNCLFRRLELGVQKVPIEVLTHIDFDCWFIANLFKHSSSPLWLSLKDSDSFSFSLRRRLYPQIQLDNFLHDHFTTRIATWIIMDNYVQMPLGRGRKRSRWRSGCVFGRLSRPNNIGRPPVSFTGGVPSLAMSAWFAKTWDHWALYRRLQVEQDRPSHDGNLFFWWKIYKAGHIADFSCSKSKRAYLLSLFKLALPLFAGELTALTKSLYGCAPMVEYRQGLTHSLPAKLWEGGIR